MQEPQNQSIKEKVLSAIAEGKIKMQPRWRFVLRAALLLLGLVLATSVLLYLASFLVFILRRSGAWFAPVFGLRGLVVLLLSLPWVLVAVSIIFVILLELLVRRYAFAYRRPLLFTVLGIVMLAVIGGVVVESSHFHEGLEFFARQHRVPLADSLYRQYGQTRPSNIAAGVITEKTAEGFRIKNRREEIINVVISPQTRFPLGTDFTEGDTVVVLGERGEGGIQASGIRKIEGDALVLPARRRGWRVRFSE